MTKKHFVALGDTARLEIKHHLQDSSDTSGMIHHDHAFNIVLKELANFCGRQNPRFDRGLWLDYVAGRCGPSGGKK